jgi:glyoxylase-like metal-dependent hydrolase (beta-lactamase superfamily II)
MQIELMNPALLQGTIGEYLVLRERVGESLFHQANKALIVWEKRAGALKSANRMRLPVDDWRAWPRVTEPALAHRRMQHPVGQGGLHAGIVRKHLHPTCPTFDEGHSASVFYVYDCGSEPRRYVDREIKALTAARAGRSLDFLFLSHFDRDHMCGTPRLLSNTDGLQVDTVVLPYIDVVERLLAFGRSAQTRGGLEANRFFADMVVDPVITLREFGPRRIVFVTTGEGPTPDLPPAAPPQGPPDRGISWKTTSHCRPLQSWSIEGEDVVVVCDPVFDLFSSGAFSVGGWRLIPYVDRVADEVVDNFQRVAEALLNWVPGSFATEVADPLVRRDLVTRHRSKMARAYRHAFGNKNTTSLSLYSGPANPHAAGGVQIWPHTAAADVAKIAWMGTGDADLRDSHSINRFEAHYRDVIEYVSTFMLPHHGSIHNSDPQRLVSNADRWVAAAEPSHDWEHPAKLLIKAVEDRGRDFQTVKSNPKSALDEALVVFWPAEGAAAS